MIADPTDRRKLMSEMVLNNPSQVSAMIAPIIDEKYKTSSLAWNIVVDAFESN